jgi:hypothetical protein
MLEVFILFIFFLVLTILFGVYLKKSLDCNSDYQQLYNETNQCKLQLENVNTDHKKLEDEQNKLNDKIKLLEKNTLGAYNDNYLKTQNNTCVKIADNIKSDYTLLQHQTNCSNQNDFKIFSYDPVYKQLLVTSNKETKCVDAINENDIVLNDCIKTSLKQKFNYYPLYDGKMKSLLYSKCLGYNVDTDIIELQNCGLKTNIETENSLRNSHLVLNNT